MSADLQLSRRGFAGGLALLALGRKPSLAQGFAGLGRETSGFAAVVPWILPAIVGIPATALWVAYYRRKFRETESPQPRRQAIPT